VSAKIILNKEHRRPESGFDQRLFEAVDRNKYFSSNETVYLPEWRTLKKWGLLIAEFDKHGAAILNISTLRKAPKPGITKIYRALGLPVKIRRGEALINFSEIEKRSAQLYKHILEAGIIQADQ
jgi:hypothetical protein